jgi:hypothetical protein
MAMGFQRFSKVRSGALYIGAPEAEAESLPNSKVSLNDVYEDHHDLFGETSNEKFIIIGRKGCGKSAFAEYSYLSSKDDPNNFCTFIRQDTVSLEQLIQLGQTAGIEQKKESLFKWLIYTNILKLFFDNEAAQQAPDYKMLKEFLKKNSGYIDIDKGEVVELVRKYKFEVSIEQFKRFFKGKYNQDVEIKESRAPYYKLLPHLEKVIVDVLTSKENIENENFYAVFFDDLDINFKASDAESVDNIISLLRTSKHVNNNVFAKNGANAKVIILIRDDVERLLSPMESDIAKLFSSYGTDLSWYEEDYSKPGKEETLGLKKLIVKRVENAFNKAEMPITNKTAWESLVGDHFTPKSAFKYIADHTFLRPRDLILFFKPLESGRYTLPLSKQDVNALIGLYASGLIKELSNELSSFYEPHQIQNIWDATKEINRQYNCTYERAIEIVREHCDSVTPEKILDDLFDRSIIGCIEKSTSFVRFKIKISKKDAEDYKIDKEGFIIVQSGVKSYLQNR